MIPEVMQEYEEDYKFFYDAAMRKIGDWYEDHFPDEVVNRILGGEHPVRVFRQYRRLSLEQLARKIGVPPSYLHDIESGKIKLSSKYVDQIAIALRVGVEEIA